MTEVTKYKYLINSIETFFKRKGFIEVNSQLINSMFTISNNKNKLFPQSGQIYLDNILLTNSSIEGCYTILKDIDSNQKTDKINIEKNVKFPMIEFGSKGDVNDMISVEKELLNFLGFIKKQKIKKKIKNTFEQEEYERINHHYNKFNRKLAISILEKNDKTFDEIKMDFPVFDYKQIKRN